MDKKILKFKGTPLSEPFFEGNNDYKMYSFSVDEELYPSIRRTKYNGSVTVKGCIHRLSIGTEYIVTAEEDYNAQYGYSYQVINIKSGEIKSNQDMRGFLQGILTPLQADELYKTYPDIVQRVMTNNLKDVDLSKLNGIGEATFEKIKTKIYENYMFADLLNEYHGLFTFTLIKNLYEKYGDTELIKKKLKESPYKFLTNQSRIGFKKADKIILDFEKQGKFETDEPLIGSKQRCAAFIDYALEEELTNGNTKIEYDKLQKRCINEVKTCAKHFVEALKDDKYHNDGKYVSFEGIYKKEEYIANRLWDAVQNPIKWDIDISKYQNENELSLTDEQLKAHQMLCDNNVCILNGPGGSGKTYTTQSIIRMLDDNKKSYILMASTGRASKVLAEYAHRPASTIHRGLGYNPNQGWAYNEKCPLPYDVIIVDEFSMVDIFLFKHLIEAIDFKKSKLFIIGDSAQLPSVSAGNCLHDMINSKAIPIVPLTKIFRYSEGGIMKAATDTRCSKPYVRKSNKKAEIYGTNRDYVFINSRDETMVNDVLNVYKKLLTNNSIDNIMLVTAYNKGDYGTVALNNQLQEIVNSNYRSTDNFQMKHATFYIDDIVMQTVNNYKSSLYDINTDMLDGREEPVFNGEMGRVVKIKANGIVIKFDDKYVFYNKKELQDIILGYAISIHKSQGGACKNVLIMSPRSHTYMLSSNLLYVALTRTTDKCYHFGQAEVINRAVKKKDDVNRLTYLCELLKNLKSS